MPFSFPPDDSRVADYAAVRSYAGASKNLYVTGYLVAGAPSGIAGPFTVDDTDTTSADNGGTILVITSGVNTGKRVKRVFSGSVNALWFGTNGVLQAAINAAAALVPNMAVIIPSSYAGTDTFTNPSGVLVIDQRKTADGVGAFGIWSIIQACRGYQNFPLGNDLVVRASGPADAYIEHLHATCTTTTALNIGANNNVLISPVTVSNVKRGNVETGTTSLLSTNAHLTINRDRADEEQINAGSWSIVDGTHISLTCANAHIGTIDIEQDGSTLLLSRDLFIGSDLVKSPNNLGSAPLRLKDVGGRIIAYIPGDINAAFPASIWRFGYIVGGAQGANADLLFQHATAASMVKYRDASGNNLLTLDNNGVETLSGIRAGSTQSPAFAASLAVNARAGRHVFVGALTNNITIGAPINGSAGMELTFQFLQDGVGGRTVTWNAAFTRISWSDAGNTASARSSISFICIDGTNWLQAGAQKAWS